MGMFMGFIPLNGPMAIVLTICLFVFKINRLAAMIVLPLFKLFYVLGVSSVADAFGGVLLINADFLVPVWSFITHFPVLALLGLNNTLVAGGLAISAILSFPVFIGAMKGIVILRTRYFNKIKNAKFVKIFLKMPIISHIVTLVNRAKGEA